jgi:hypothetical protein
MILHPVVPPGLKHHPSYLQRFCCYRFQQGVMDEKMLEKLAAHDVQDISELFSLADKCARAAEGHAWHSQPASEVGKGSKPKANAAAQRNDKNTNRKKKKKAGGSLPAATRGCLWCPVHYSKCHNAEECREIKKLTETSMSSSRAATACLLTSGQASSKLSMRATMRRRWSSRTPRG